MNTIKKYLTRLLGFFPRTLPGGTTEFEALVTRLMSSWNLPTTSDRDVKFALTTTIMHLGPQDSSRSDYYFVKTIRAGAAKQVAGAKFHEIKSAHTAEVNAAKQAEVISLKTAPSSEQQG